MMPIDPTIVVQSISALAALIRLWRETRNTPSGPTPSQIDAVQQQARKDPDVETITTLHTVIPAETLAAIDETIERARKRFDKALRNPANTKEAKDAEEEVARATICGELKRIKRLNGQQLPKKHATDWASFECASLT
jgi:hypothetical protein